MVGAAVPCRPPRPQPTVGAAVPCGPSHQPHGRGRSPLRPAVPPDREAVSLKTCSPLFLSGTCGALDGALATSFVAPRSFFSHSPRSPRSPRPFPCGRQGLPPLPLDASRSPPSLYIFYISYTVNPLPPHSLRSPRSLREIFYPPPIPLLHFLHSLHG